MSRLVRVLRTLLTTSVQVYLRVQVQPRGWRSTPCQSYGPSLTPHAPKLIMDHIMFLPRIRFLFLSFSFAFSCLLLIYIIPDSLIIYILDYSCRDLFAVRVCSRSAFPALAWPLGLDPHRATLGWHKKPHRDMSSPPHPSV